jgi:hypothetical protein
MGREREKEVKREGEEIFEITTYASSGEIMDC